MVETRGNRRKSVAPARVAASGTAAAAPSGSDRPAAGAGAGPGEPIDYAEMYRQAARQRKQEEHSNVVRRVIGHAKLLYHQQSITWAWYMLDTWETLLWMCFLVLLTYFVLSASFVASSSICRTTLLAAHSHLAQQGAKLFNFTR